MKIWSVALPAVVSALLLFAGCQQVTVSSPATMTGGCLTCHSSTSSSTSAPTYGLTGAALTNANAYALSGHYLGYRTVTTAGAYTNTLEVTGSSGCSQCHTTSGFTTYTSNAGPIALVPGATTTADGVMHNSITINAAESASTVNSCLVCHDPHAQFNLGIRTINVDVNGLGGGVLMDSGNITYGMGTFPLTIGGSSYYATAANSSSLTYNSGTGNVCVNCHQDRTTEAAKNIDFAPTVLTAGTAGNLATYTSGNKWVKTVDSTAPTLAVGGTPHHGVQGDVLLSADSAGYVATYLPYGYTNSYAAETGTTPVTFVTTSGKSATSPHYANSSANAGGFNSCSTCHIELSDHSMYLTTAAGDNVAVCAACHSSANAANNLPAGSTILYQTGSKTFATVITKGVNPDPILADIQAAKLTLVEYFGYGGNFYGVDPTNPSPTTNKGAASGTPIYISLGSAPNGIILKTDSSTAWGCDAGTSYTNSGYSTATNTGNSLPTTTCIMNKDWVTLSGSIASSHSSAGTAFAASSVSAVQQFADTNVFLTQAQAQAWYNFMVYNEDRSEGVHNPRYAAELLYDAIKLLGLPDAFEPSDWQSNNRP